jgi:CPA2 family monovalent cation:H+ antiporter-2
LTTLFPHLLAAGAAPDFLIEVVILIVAGAAIAYLCHRLGLVPIVGFLVTGVLIGPYGLGLVKDRMLVDATAELGVVLLLFTIGIEFSLEKLARIKGLIFGGGGLQVGLTTLGVVLLLLPFGVPWQIGVFTGFLVALSSTAIVLKLLADKAETSAPHGQVSLGFLIFQDLAIIVMVLLVPLLAGMAGTGGAEGMEAAAHGGADPGSIFLALGKAAGIIVLVLVFARKLMPPLLEKVARTCSPELFLLTLIAICFGTALITSLADVSLSLGAFLAGLLVSESRFSEHALGEILPLQILFSATFFISVGMLLDVGFLVRNLPLVCGVLVAVLVLKFLTTGISALALGYPLPVAVGSALILAQVGEFSFVLERAGREAGLFPAGMAEVGSQVFIAATVVLMVATPALASLGSRLQQRLAARPEAGAAEMEAAVDPEEIPHLENHVIVAGYGQAARRLVRVLKSSGIPFLITTLSPTGANEAEADGLPVLRGDAGRLRTLLLAGLERAKLLVIPDDEPAMAGRIAAVARTAGPTLRIVARTRYIAEIGSLTEHGADRVVAEELESIVQLFATVLRNYRVEPEEIESYERTLRDGGYAALQAEALPEGLVHPCTLDEGCLDQRTITLRAGMPALGSGGDGRRVSDLGLETQHGIRVDAVRRRGVELEEPQNTVLQLGDELVLVGSAAAFAESAPLFRKGSAQTPAEVRSSRRTGIDTEKLVALHPAPGAVKLCGHLGEIRAVLPSAPGCEVCLRVNHRNWVHLRVCMTCGHVGCCDSSPGKHASAHFHTTGHPVMRSLDPGEAWGWCFEDQALLEPGDA